MIIDTNNQYGVGGSGYGASAGVSNLGGLSGSGAGIQQNGLGLGGLGFGGIDPRFGDGLSGLGLGDWSDTLIGAGGGFGTAMLIFGGLLVAGLIFGSPAKERKRKLREETERHQKAIRDIRYKYTRLGVREGKPA